MKTGYTKPTVFTIPKIIGHAVLIVIGSLIGRAFDRILNINFKEVE